MRYLLGLLLAVVLAGCASPAPTAEPMPTPSPTPTAASSPTPSPSPSTSPSPLASPSVTCVSEVVTLPSGGRMADECPSAIVAFGAVAAPLGSIARIHIDPRPFACGNLWPGIASTPVCFGALILSGSAMHGWATFVG